MYLLYKIKYINIFLYFFNFLVINYKNIKNMVMILFLYYRCILFVVVVCLQFGDLVDLFLSIFLFKFIIFIMNLLKLIKVLRFYLKYLNGFFFI